MRISKQMLLVLIALGVVAMAGLGCELVGTPTVAPSPSALPMDTSIPGTEPTATSADRRELTPTASDLTPTLQRPTALTLAVNVEQERLNEGFRTFVVPHVLERGGKATVTLTLWNATKGLSGYDLMVKLDPGDVAEVVAVRLPDYGLNQVSDVLASSVRIRVADLNKKVLSEDQEQLLATLEISGKAPGKTTVAVQVTAMDSENGDALKPDIRTVTLEIR